MLSKRLTLPLSKGISLFLGLDHGLADCLSYLEKARQAGYDRLFTSLHIPEANAAALLSQCQELITTARQSGFSVTADISPATLDLLQSSMDDLTPLKKLGLSALRLDYGFAAQDIVRIAKATGAIIELNASTVTSNELSAVSNAGLPPHRLQACHNYYPRPETGLSYELFVQRSRFLRDHGIPVLAFIPSLVQPRAPLYSGLPTLEIHRGHSSLVAAKHLAASGLVQGILFGDPFAAEQELHDVAKVTTDCLELRFVAERPLTDAEAAIVLAPRHTNRHDPGAYAARSQEARLLRRAAITAARPLARPRGSITLDNEDYGRYQGELQLILQPLPADERVNVVGHVIPDDLLLLDFLRPGQPFRFIQVKTERTNL